MLDRAADVRQSRADVKTR